jgi:hypothetical protein
MYPSQVMKFTSFSEGQQFEQNGTITYLKGVFWQEEKRDKKFINY